MKSSQAEGGELSFDKLRGMENKFIFIQLFSVASWMKSHHRDVEIHQI